jgi:hypothetical protein
MFVFQTGIGVTFVHTEQAGVQVFIEGDQTLLHSHKEISNMCEDILAETKFLRNAAQAEYLAAVKANQTHDVIGKSPRKGVDTFPLERDVVPMSYPKSGIRLQPPAEGIRSSISKCRSQHTAGVMLKRPPLLNAA